VLSRPRQHLAAWTTLRLGGPAADFVEVDDADDAVAAVSDADAAGRPVLVLGSGSNLVVADAGFSGTVVHVTSRGIDVRPDDDCSYVRVAAGESWERFVERAVDEGWAGVEALAGIPGSVGATPIQNVGAYGQEVADTIASVQVYDRTQRHHRTLTADDCGFGYRTSRLKAERDRFLVLAVTFRLRHSREGLPVRYAELARRLDIDMTGCAPTADVRRAVLALRAAKGMVLDPGDRDTWSAGSFFTNPFVEPSALPAGAPAFGQPDGRVKTSAAWLIERAGYGKGYGNDKVSLSTKHTLALTNRGSATTRDLLALAREIRSGVRDRLGITLEPEPVLVGCSLD
jgi:UDP-N-acetylmuramate dehydrogenase